MRWVASLFALCLTMAWLHHLTAGSSLEARASFALGFLLVAAWLAGELAARARVPRLTGFLILGLCVGPTWLNLVRADELESLGFLAHAAVAWIAFAAGLELSFAALRTDRRVLTRMVGGTLAFPMAAVAAVMLSVAAWFPLTAHQGFRNAVGLALTLGVCAAASSPVVIMAVLDEFGLRGSFAESALSVAVIKDVALMGVFALVLLAARGLGTPGAVDGAVATVFAARLAAAVGIGAVLGLMASRYARVAERESVLVLLGMVLVVAALDRALGLEATVVALAAGAAARNAGGPGAASLRARAGQASLPVQAVLFGLAGAALRLGALAELWPWVVLLVGLRAVALRYGTLWAGRAAAVSPALARHGWLALVSQSGIPLAVGAAARRAFPAWGISLEGLVAGTVALDQVVGPLCLQWALRQVGDTERGAPERAASAASPGAIPGGAGWSPAPPAEARNRSPGPPGEWRGRGPRPRAGHSLTEAIGLCHGR